MIVQEVSNRVGYILTDTTAVRWTLPERELWINDGIRELLTLVPSAYVKHATLQLVEGELQALPSDCRALLEVRFSQQPMSDSRLCVRKVSREMLSIARSLWINRQGRGEVREYSYDASDPLRFYVFPAQPDEPGLVEIVYQAVAPWVSLAAEFPLRDDYAMAVVNYVLHRAYSKDAEFAGNAQIAVSYYQAFKTALSGAG